MAIFPPTADAPLPQWPPAAPVIPQPPALLSNTGPSVSPNNGKLGYTNSAYGGVLPIVYGADRLSGNVIWASAPLTVNTVDANGQPFSYQTVDFALALCEGVINGVLRMWVGDNLVLDNTVAVSGGNIATPGPNGQIGAYAIDLTDPVGVFANLGAANRQTKITIFTGDETQIAQGAMVSSDGYDATPAYRGVAYILFENFLIAQNNVPAVFVEITSHTSAAAPRLYGDFVGTTFDTWKYFMLQYDQSYDRFYAVGQKTSPAAVGIEVISGNTLTELAQFEINNLFGIGPDYSTTCVMPLSGLLVAAEPSGNAGLTYVLSPLSGGLLAKLGPGGNLSSHSLTNGFAVLAAYTVCAFSCPESSASSIPIDVFCGVGYINQSVGFAKIGDNGSITMLSSLNLVTPWINNVVQPITIDQSFYATPANRKFYDGVASLGTHVFGFSYRNNENASIKVFRVTAYRHGLPTGDVSLSAPVYQELAEISVDRFGGAGFSYTVRFAFVDRVDNCIVLAVEASSGRGPYFAKYSPFTGSLKWVTAVTGFPSSGQNIYNPNVGIVTGTYAWIDGNNAVWKIDLSNGALTSATTLTAESLPAMSNAMQFYNGVENSITYLTGTGTKHITKLFLDRQSRLTIELADIVTDLIERTGLLPSDITVNDLAALTLHGYTISQVQSVRTCFSELGQAFTYDVAESNGKILFKTRGNGVDVTIPHSYIQGASGTPSNNDEWMKATQQNDGSRLRKINLTYRDIDRDYSNNVQSVLLTKTGSQVFDPEAFIDVTVPIVLTADEAKVLAEILLYAKLTYNTTFEFTVAPYYIVLDPADVVSITMPAGEDNLTVRLRDVTIDTDNSVQCKASEENSDIYTDQINLFGSIGRFEKQVIPALSPRIDPFMLQIPGRNEEEIGVTETGYQLFIAFLNSAPASPNDNILVTIDSTLYVIDGSTFATWGYVVTPPNNTKSTAATDYDSIVTVQMIGTSGAALASAAGGIDDLLASDQVNLCYIAGELFQFITATNTSGNIWELTGLHRAKFGTDPAVGTARVGDRFVLLAGNDGLLDTNGIVAVRCALGSSSAKVVTVKMNTGNPFQPPFSTIATAENLRPFRVADFEMSYVSTDVVMVWQRRDRTGDGDYPDDGSVPPSESVGQPEQTESYDLYLYKDAAAFVVTDPTTYLRKVTVTTNTFTYTAAMQTADGFTRATDTLYVLIQQTGAWDGIGGYTETEVLNHV